MKIDILGIQIDNLKKIELLKKVEDLLKLDKAIFIVTPYSESIVAAQKDEEFKKVLNAADIALPDGIGILWAAKFLESGIRNQESGSTPSVSPPKIGGDQRGGMSHFIKVTWDLVVSLLAMVFNPSYIRDPVPEKISGSEFIWNLAELAQKNNYSIFLLGGFGDTPELVAHRLKTKFPNLKIAGASNASPPSAPRFRRSGEGESERGFDVIEKINQSRADFLFVALGPVAQEKWIYQNLPNLRVKLAIGLGGTFDYLAGKRPYRAQFWASTGLEWLYRLLTQPRRLGRILKGVLGLILYSLIEKLDKEKIDVIN